MYDCYCWLWIWPPLISVVEHAETPLQDSGPVGHRSTSGAREEQGLSDVHELWLASEPGEFCREPWKTIIFEDIKVTKGCVPVCPLSALTPSILVILPDIIDCLLIYNASISARPSSSDHIRNSTNFYCYQTFWMWLKYIQYIILNIIIVIAGA